MATDIMKKIMALEAKNKTAELILGELIQDEASNANLINVIRRLCSNRSKRISQLYIEEENRINYGLMGGEDTSVSHGTHII